MPCLWVTIHGEKHCFPIPVLIEKVPKPIPPNWPDLELAVTVVQLVEDVKPAVRDTELTKALTAACNGFIQKVQNGLPKGVELSMADELMQPGTKVA